MVSVRGRLAKRPVMIACTSLVDAIELALSSVSLTLL